MTKDKMSFHVTVFSQKSIATCTLQETQRFVCYLLLTILKKCFEKKNTDTHTRLRESLSYTTNNQTESYITIESSFQYN
jgi:hypothetical protein